MTNSSDFLVADTVPSVLLLGFSEDNTSLRALRSELEKAGFRIYRDLGSVVKADAVPEIEQVYIFNQDSDDVHGSEAQAIAVREASIHAPITILAPRHVLIANDSSLLDMVRKNGLNPSDVTEPPRILMVRAAAITTDIRRHADLFEVLVMRGQRIIPQERGEVIRKPELFVFHLSARLVTGTGHIPQMTQNRVPSLSLTLKEASIFRLLAAAHANDRGQSVARTRLLDEVWGYAANVTTHTLETHVYRLRQKMNQAMSPDFPPGDEKNNFVIQTVSGGYRLNPELRVQRLRTSRLRINLEMMRSIVSRDLTAAGLVAEEKPQPTSVAAPTVQARASAAGILTAPALTRPVFKPDKRGNYTDVPGFHG